MVTINALLVHPCTAANYSSLITATATHHDTTCLALGPPDLCSRTHDHPHQDGDSGSPPRCCFGGGPSSGMRKHLWLMRGCFSLLPSICLPDIALGCVGMLTGKTGSACVLIGRDGRTLWPSGLSGHVWEARHTRRQRRVSIWRWSSCGGWMVEEWWWESAFQVRMYGAVRFPFPYFLRRRLLSPYRPSGLGLLPGKNSSGNSGIVDASASSSW